MSRPFLRFHPLPSVTRNGACIAGLAVLLTVTVHPVEAQLGRLDQLADIEASLADLSALAPENVSVLRKAASSLAEVCTDEDLARIQVTRATFEQILADEQRLRGSASFSYRDNQASGRNASGDTTVDPERQVIATSASLSRGRYPLELDLNTSVALARTESGVINEAISSLFFSVDQNLDRSWLEGYAFLERSSDAFLSIDQRYETGAGLVFNARVGLTQKGRDLERRLLYGSSEPADSIWAETSSWTGCLDAVAGVQGLSEEASQARVRAALKNLEQASLVARRSVAEGEPLVRLALLVGVQGEVEQARIDGFESSDRGFRAVVRPTVAIEPLDGIRLRADYYLNIALSGFSDPETFREQIVRDLFPSGTDVRSELSLRLSSNVRGVTLNAQHVRLWDSHPPFFVVDGQIVTDADGEPVVAAWRRNLTTFGVAVPF
ncbi:MAG: hypothetical protein AAGI52_12365 [Bacteroidota bacterium]